MSNQNSYFRRKPLHDVLTHVDQSIRKTVLETGFGELMVEVAPADDPKQLRIIVRDTAHYRYLVTAEDMRQFLTSGPHFSASYVSSELWRTLGHRFHIICGEEGTGYGHICLSTTKRKYQQEFTVVGGVSDRIRINHSDMNL